MALEVTGASDLPAGGVRSVAPDAGGLKGPTGPRADGPPGGGVGTIDFSTPERGLEAEALSPAESEFAGTALFAPAPAVAPRVVEAGAEAGVDIGPEREMEAAVAAEGAPDPTVPAWIAEPEIDGDGGTDGVGRTARSLATEAGEVLAGSPTGEDAAAPGEAGDPTGERRLDTDSSRLAAAEASPEPLPERLASSNAATGAPLAASAGFAPRESENAADGVSGRVPCDGDDDVD